MAKYVPSPSTTSAAAPSSNSHSAAVAAVASMSPLQSNREFQGHSETSVELAMSKIFTMKWSSTPTST